MVMHAYIAIVTRVSVVTLINQNMKLCIVVHQRTQHVFKVNIIQGDPNQNLLIQMAITLKISVSEPMFRAQGNVRLPPTIQINITW